MYLHTHTYVHKLQILNDCSKPFESRLCIFFPFISKYLHA